MPLLLWLWHRFRSSWSLGIAHNLLVAVSRFHSTSRNAFRRVDAIAVRIGNAPWTV
jgi:hypothetical protein